MAGSEFQITGLRTRNMFVGGRGSRIIRSNDLPPSDLQHHHPIKPRSRPHSSPQGEDEKPLDKFVLDKPEVQEDTFTGLTNSTVYLQNRASAAEPLPNNVAQVEKVENKTADNVYVFNVNYASAMVVGAMLAYSLWQFFF